MDDKSYKLLDPGGTALRNELVGREAIAGQRGGSAGHGSLSFAWPIVSSLCCCGVSLNAISIDPSDSDFAPAGADNLDGDPATWPPQCSYHSIF